MFDQSPSSLEVLYLILPLPGPLHPLNGLLSSSQLINAPWTLPLPKHQLCIARHILTVDLGLERALSLVLLIV